LLEELFSLFWRFALEFVKEGSPLSLVLMRNLLTFEEVFVVRVRFHRSQLEHGIILEALCLVFLQDRLLP
jgi:hypothetical protein